MGVGQDETGILRRSSDSAEAAPWWSRRKHVDAKGRRSHQLAKNLSALQLVPIGVGTTIGAGVYVLVGTVAREKSGPALTISFLIAGIAAAFSAFCYAELASRCPSAGSAYHYSYICIGEVVAWFIGWGLILEYVVGASAVARGISPNLALLLGGDANLPSWLSRSTIPGTSIEVDPCAAILVILVTALLCVGVKESATVQAIVTCINVSVLMFVIVAGAIIGFKTDWIGYRQADGFLPFGVNGMLGGAATVFFAYIGFDSVASTAEEVKHPQRDLPLGIGIALSICGTLYMLVSAVIVGIVPYDEIDVNTPMSAAFSRYGVDWAMYIVSAGAVAALSSALMGSLLPQPRILMAMARDGLLPYLFLDVNRYTSVPINSTILSGAVAMLLAFFMNVDQLSGMVSVGTLLAFAAVSVSILVLRFVPPVDIIISSTSSLPNMDSGNIFGCKQDGTRPLLVEDQEHQVDSCETTTQVDGEHTFPSNSENKRRLWAAMGIFASFIGAIFIAISASGSLLPSWSRWTLGGAGGGVFLMGAIVMGCLKQDEGRHTFGHSKAFRCPFVPWLPLLSILINVYLLANLGLMTWLRVGAWLIVGAGVYFSYGIRNSLLLQQDMVAEAIEKSESFAPLV